MTIISKKPYKITLWEDKNIYIVNGQKKEVLDNGDTVQNQYLEEVCVAIIGSDTMDTPIRAFNPVLTQDLNGSNVLTFQILHHYWDNKDGDFKENPFINLLVNERKVKLKYDNQWYEFVIKQSQENSDNNTFTYTCKDLYINELGKTGYEVELDTELLNNMGTVTQLATSILEGTDWKVGESDLLIQYNKEMLYYCDSHPQFNAISMTTNNTITVPENAAIYVFYSCKANKEVPIQFLYVENGIYKKDEYGFIVNSLNWRAESFDYVNNNMVPSDYFGKKIIQLAKSAYLPQIEEVCTFWNHEPEDRFQLSQDTEVIPGKEYYQDAEGTIQVDTKIKIGNYYLGDITRDGKVDEDDHTFLARSLADWPGYEINPNVDPELFQLADIDQDGDVDLRDRQILFRYLDGWDGYDSYFYITANPSAQGWYERSNAIPPGDYYCYNETKYSTVAEIQNMISNSTEFTSTNGWVAVGSGSSVTTEVVGSQDQPYYECLTLKGNVYNTGFYDNRVALAPNGFVKGDTYILAVSLQSGTLNSTPGLIKVTPTTNTSQDVTILEFKTDLSGDACYPDVFKDGDDELYQLYEGSISQTINYNHLIGASTSGEDYDNIKFFLNFSGTVKIKDCRIFKKRLDGKKKLIVPDLEDLYYELIVNPDENANPRSLGWYEDSNGKKILSTDEEVIGGKTYYTGDSKALRQTWYNFFPVTTDLTEVFSKEDLKLTVSTIDPSSINMTQLYSEDYEKVTSITGSKSNRFNLIQNLCEAFECWARFEIGHDDMGKITYQYVKINNADFKEGARYYTWIDGNGPTSSNDDTKFAIYKGATYINNLYKKVFDKNVVFKEYIGKENWAGFRYGINLKSIQRNVVSDQIATKVIVKANTNEFAPNGSCTIQQSLLNPTGENALYNFQYYLNHGLLDKQSLYDDLYGTGGGLGFFTKMWDYNQSIRTPIEQLTLVSRTINELLSRYTVYSALLSEAEELYNDSMNELTNSGYDMSSSSAPDYILTLRDKIKAYQNMKEHYEDVTRTTKNNLSYYQHQYMDIEVNLEEVEKQKEALNFEFHRKYYGYIQEGTWNSNDYWDPDLYYQAANMVLYTSSFPQVSYSFGVLELSQVEGYEPYTFAIGDKTYIEDVEFFGYDDKGRPYKEEVVLSQIKYNLDDPSQNTITIQNYKTQFQDLFQRIAATSQSLQYHEGEYNRAADAINSNGTIDKTLLQNSIEANALILQNANNQSVVWDDGGITITNFTNSSEIVKLTSGGIILSNDGGRSWTSGITGDGINANTITAGSIDTSLIKIYDNGMPAFVWDKNGINAYMKDGSNPIDYNKVVRFSKFGLYGHIGTGTDIWNPQNISDVINNSVFSLTWKGLKINLPSGQGFSIVSNPSGNPKNQGWYEYNNLNQVYEKTTDTEVDPSTTYYENNDVLINVNNAFTVDGAGNINATSGSFSGTLASGVSITSPVITGGSINGTSINIGNGNFVVNSSGALTANSGTFSGDITAKTLKIRQGNRLVNIINYIDESSGSDFDITSATGDFSGTFSGSIDTNDLAFKVGNTTYGTIGYENYGIELASEAGVRIMADYYDEDYPGNVFIRSSGSNSGVNVYASLILFSPYDSEGRKAVFNCPVEDGSDIRLKNSVDYDIGKYENFIKMIKPATFKYNGSSKLQFGFIAQDVKNALEKNNYNIEDFGILGLNKIEEEEFFYSLNYNNFIAIQQWQIQKLEKRIEALENLTSSSNSDIL